MKGGLTWQEMELRKQKAANLDDALEYLEGRQDNEKLMAVDRILRRGLAELRTRHTEPTP